MEDIFNRLQSHFRKGLPFAVYCKPGSETITGLFQTDNEGRYLSNFSEQGFIFAPFTGNKYAFIPAGASEVLMQNLDDAPKASKDFQPTIDASAKESFEALVAKGVTAINEGKFKKVVLSRKQAVPLAEEDMGRLFQRLTAAYPNAFRYCFYHPATGLWMGATPEQLLKLERNTLHTVALAGTQLYKKGETAVWENKEKEEQQFVTDFITGSLRRYSENIIITPPYTFRAGNLVHIKTDISAELKEGSGLDDIIPTLHPTPAVCGSPKAAGMDFILQHEGYDREYYSGFLGELNRNFATAESSQTDLFVNLRCMKIEGKAAHLYIGCGITKDSDPEKEFIETVNKAATMGRVLR
jgi:isochorismate synthase